jgi:transposase-like protein
MACGPVFGPPLGTSIGPERKGKKGRPRKIDSRLGEILDLLVVEKLSIRKIADLLGVSHMTVYRALERSDVEMLVPG